MEKMIVVADLGRLRAFRLAPEDPLDGGNVHAHEVEISPLDEQPESVHEMVTDQAGRFARGSRVGRMTGMSRSEANGMLAEQEARLIKLLASRIESLAAGFGTSEWTLVAPDRICKRLESTLGAGVKDSLCQVEKADLTHASLQDIEKRFGW